MIVMLVGLYTRGGCVGAAVVVVVGNKVNACAIADNASTIIAETRDDIVVFVKMFFRWS